MYRERFLQMTATKEDLALTIDETEWSWLRAHLERGGLILVNDSLDLAEAGTQGGSRRCCSHRTMDQ